MSVVQWLANLSPHRKARDGIAVAPLGLVHLPASVFTPPREARPPPNCAGTADPHPPHDHGEPTLGSAADPGGARETWVQSFSQNSRQDMQRTDCRGPSTTWRSFLRQHGWEIWARDFFCVRTITLRVLYVFFVIDHASRQALHVHVTPSSMSSCIPF